MTCENFLSEMYAQRFGDNCTLSPEFADHLHSCASCSHKLARMVRHDASIRRTMRAVEAPTSLEASILSGLALERNSTGWPTQKRSQFWRRWVLIPVAAVVLAAVSLLGYTQWRSHALLQQATAFLREAPPLDIDGGERAQILRWSAQVVPGSDSLPRRLDRLQFQGASAVQINKQSAVLLHMKHEPRASLLVFAHSLLGTRRIESYPTAQGSLACWSEQKKTYVLLFHGGMSDLQSYMQRMGITT